MADEAVTAETGLSVEEGALRRFGRAEAVASVLNNIVRYGGLVAIAYFAYRSIEVLAGTSTVADIGIDVAFLANVSISKAIAWTFGATGVGYGLVQRKLRQDTVERLQGRVKKFEIEADPERSSSRLTTRGDTRPEDRI